MLIFVYRAGTIGSVDKRCDKLFKLTEGQFGNAKIKVPSTKVFWCGINKMQNC